jgi:hypothetical protein
VSEPGLERDSDVLRVALGLLRARLPLDWSMSEIAETRLGDHRAEAVVRLGAPDGAAVTLVIECRRLLVSRDLPAVTARLEQLSASAGGRVVPVVVARYLPAPVRARLEGAGLSYLDATGNMRVVANEPALFLGDRGADQDPWRGPGRPRGSLKGVPAARVVRALTDFVVPMSVPQLIERSRSSTGAAYRVVEFLQEQELLTRDGGGRIVQVDWVGVLQRWSQDYSFPAASTDRRSARFLHPRGLTALEATIAAGPAVRYALTGTLAAARWAAYAPPRLAMIYVDDPQWAAQAWGLREVDAGANVLLAAPDADFVYERAVTADGLTLAAPSQTAVDLLTGPGRNPSEAQFLLDWMRSHELDWRR